MSVQPSKLSRRDFNETLTKHHVRYMPPTAPAGMACVAVVFARLIDLEGRDRGIKSFVVNLHDGETMYPGVTCKYVGFDIIHARIFLVLSAVTDYSLLVEALALLIIPSHTSITSVSHQHHCLAPRRSLPTNMAHSSTLYIVLSLVD